MFLVLRVNRVYSYTLHDPLFTPHRRPGYKAPHQCFGRWPHTQSDSSLRVKKSQTLLYSVLRRMTDLLWTFGLAAPNYCIDPCLLYEYMSTFVDSVEGDTRYTRNIPPFSHCDISLYLFTFTRHSVQAQGVGEVIHHYDHPPPPPSYISHCLKIELPHSFWPYWDWPSSFYNEVSNIFNKHLTITLFLTRYKRSKTYRFVKLGRDFS